MKESEKSMHPTDKVIVGFGSTMFVLWLLAFAAWVTNIVWIFKILMATANFATGIYVLAVITGVVPPLGIIHGVFMWFAGWTAL
jgi:inner membrane protein involved in colicin E2 resistance